MDDVNTTKFIFNVCSKDDNIFKTLRKYFFIFSAITLLIYVMINLLNSKSAEEFYGVPKKYFLVNISGKEKLLVWSTLLYFLFLSSLISIKYIVKIKDGSYWNYLLIVALLVIFFLFIFALLPNTRLCLFELLKDKRVTIPLTILLLTITTILFLIIKAIEYIGCTRINIKIWSTLLSIMYLIAIVLIIVNDFYIDYYNKKEYEIATIKCENNSSEYVDMLVVGNYKDSLVLLDIESNKSGELIFKKGQVFFKSYDNVKIRKEIFSKVEGIDKTE